MANYALQTKTRAFNTTESPISGQSRTSGYAPWTPYSIQPGGSETIKSRCHHGYWRGSGAEGDVGGEMELSRKWYGLSKSPDQMYNHNTLNGYLYFGYQSGWSPAWSDPIIADATLRNFGAKAIGLTAPNDPASNVATFIGELRNDGLPSLPGESFRERTAIARSSGNEYLNYQFGWAPMVSDLNDFLSATRNASKIINQYVRDSGRVVRRRYAADPVIEQRFSRGGGWAYPIDQNVVTSGYVHEVRTTELWFSGAFQYFVPVPDSTLGRIRYYESLANKLYGTRITPEVVWELAPWSWAVDWFTNVGDVMHNISLLGSDGLVMKYGYAMRKQKLETHMRHTINGGQGVYRAGSALSREQFAEHKHRIRANPYGFNIDFPGLSAKQASILAALGLTKGRRDGNIHPETS